MGCQRLRVWGNTHTAGYALWVFGLPPPPPRCLMCDRQRHKLCDSAVRLSPCAGTMDGSSTERVPAHASLK